MSRILCLDKFFIWTVTIEPFEGEDDFNKPSYGTACEYKAKIERQSRIERGESSQDIRNRRLIYLLTDDTNISVKDRLTLPAQFATGPNASTDAGRQPKILDVRIVHDDQGVHHIVLVT